MRNAWILTLAFLLLSGCGAKEPVKFETVQDVLPVCALEDAPYEIAVHLPEEAQEVACHGGGTVYEGPDGVYTIYTRVLVSDSFDAAVYTLSGFAQPQIRVITEEALGDACQFAWCSAGEAGEMICRAKVLRVGDYYYALCFSLKEGLGSAYNDCINAVFSSFGIQERTQTVGGSEEAEVFSQHVADQIPIANDIPAIVGVQHIQSSAVGYSG